MREFDVVVVRCGAAGLMSAYELAKRNISVLIVSKGLGATAMSSGTIDLVGYFQAVCSWKTLWTLWGKLLKNILNTLMVFWEEVLK